MSTSPHRFACRVYYEDTDFSGVVYHASYLRFMERGRTEFLREIGVDQTTLFAGADPIGFVVRAMTLEFLRPARMDDLLAVETWLVRLGGASFDMIQRVRRGDERLVSATLRAAAVGGGRPKRLPPALAARFAARLAAPDDACAAPSLDRPNAC